MRNNRMRQTESCGHVVIGLVLAFNALHSESFAAPPVWLKAEFFTEPSVNLKTAAASPVPSIEFQIPWLTLPPANSGGIAGGTVGPDQYVSDGEQTGLAVSGENLVAAHNNIYFSGTPAIASSNDANASWTPQTFPVGVPPYDDYPWGPWGVVGNLSGEFFSSMSWVNASAINSHIVVARSDDNGANWTKFYEKNKTVLQDHPTFDLDRTTALGGGSGAIHDGKLYLCYDDFGAGGASYIASYMQLISPTGVGMTELLVSSLSNPRGAKVQPVAGVEDGQVYLVSHSFTPPGTIWMARFHVLSNGGTTAQFDKSNFSYPIAGQILGPATGRRGVNGHRIDPTVSMDIDRTVGSRRGYLYVISNRNPNPANATLDQGDVFLSISTNAAANWNSTIIPGQTPGKTQFFPMMDVDDNGWIHVAYYQNESGVVNEGVFNAGTARLYGTISYDGGATWAEPVVVNDPLNDLDYFQPPPDLSPSYYLLGDYNQVRATGTGENTKAYALWTSYDKDRGDKVIGDKRARVICTTLPDFGGPPPSNDACGSALVALAGSHAFNTSAATTDGPIESACNANGSDQVTNDVWFLFPATCDGTATISTCGANFDSRIAVYGSSCPGSTSGLAIACNDSNCGDDAQVSFTVAAGQIFRVRVGGFNGATGSGTLVISCGLPSCPADVTGNGIVDVDDLLAVINNWGNLGQGDITGNGIVDVDDLLAVINGWGACD
jgi:hypothetical protein